MAQRKEQEKSPEELNEMEANTFSDIEIKVMVIRMLNSIKMAYKP